MQSLKVIHEHEIVLDWGWGESHQLLVVGQPHSHRDDGRPSPLDAVSLRQRLKWIDVGLPIRHNHDQVGHICYGWWITWLWGGWVHSSSLVYLYLSISCSQMMLDLASIHWHHKKSFKQLHHSQFINLYPIVRTDSLLQFLLPPM